MHRPSKSTLKGPILCEDPIEKQRTSLLEREVRVIFMREQGLPTAINQLTFSN
jgi:hypothetical protein